MCRGPFTSSDLKNTAETASLPSPSTDEDDKPVTKFESVPLILKQALVDGRTAIVVDPSTQRSPALRAVLNQVCKQFGCAEVVDFTRATFSKDKVNGLIQGGKRDKKELRVAIVKRGAKGSDLFAGVDGFQHCVRPVTVLFLSDKVDKAALTQLRGRFERFEEGDLEYVWPQRVNADAKCWRALIELHRTHPHIPGRTLNLTEASTTITRRDVRVEAARREVAAAAAAAKAAVVAARAMDAASRVVQELDDESVDDDDDVVMLDAPQQ